MRLKGKVALVTGFGSGLGRAIARCYAVEGAAVMGTSTTQEKGKDTIELIRKEEGKALFRTGDVSKSDQMKAVVEKAVENFGGLDVVVNSAGVRSTGSITTLSEEDWDRTLNTNLKGIFIVSRLCIPEMVKRGGGVITMTEAMAMDLAPKKIRVNCICPGPTRTPMVDTSTPERMARYATRVPMGRIGEPEDIAQAGTLPCLKRGLSCNRSDTLGGWRYAPYRILKV